MNEVAVIALRLRELLADIADVALSEVPDNLDLAHDLRGLPLDIDSLDALKFGLSVAQEFQIADVDEVVGDLSTLNELAVRIAHKVNHAEITS